MVNLEKDLLSFLNKNNIHNFEIHKINEEGSNRVYYRIKNKVKTFVLCTTYPFIVETDDFIQITNYLQNKKANIASIIDYLPEKGWILLEDGGNVYLEEIIKDSKNDPDFIIHIYKKIIKELIKWHSWKNIPIPVKNRFFDKQKLEFEIDFFIERTKKNNFLVPSFEFQFFLKEIVNFLSDIKEYVFTHRDFHSRNILFFSKNSNFKIIDYQDARMGLRWYDVSSLLFDPYVQLDHSIILKLFQYYYKLSKLPNNKKEYYLHIFYLQALQRLVKALGSFLYLGFELHKKNFIQYILPTIKQIIQLSRMAKFPDCIYLYCIESIKHLKEHSISYVKL